MFYLCIYCYIFQLIQHSYTLRKVTIEELDDLVLSMHLPVGPLKGLHYHDPSKWREFFIEYEIFYEKCRLVAIELVNSMNDLSLFYTGDQQPQQRHRQHNSLAHRRQLYAQQRTLSRTLMDSKLHDLRKNGKLILQKLYDLIKEINCPKTTSTTTTSTTTTIKEKEGIATLTSTATTTISDLYHLPRYSSNNLNNSLNKNCNNLQRHWHYNQSNSLYYNFKQQLKQVSQATTAATTASTATLTTTQVPNISMEKNLLQNSSNSNTSQLLASNNKTTTSTSRLQSQQKQEKHNNNNYNNNNNNNNLNNNNNENVNMNYDAMKRLERVELFYNEIDRTAKRLEQLIEQRREHQRELNRQRALQEELKEVSKIEIF